MHDLPVTRQCQILPLARSTAYYRAQEASETGLGLMRRIAAPHLKHPFTGSRICAACCGRTAIQSATGM